jgi:hypothetical protein
LCEEIREADRGEKHTRGVDRPLHTASPVLHNITEGAVSPDSTPKVRNEKAHGNAMGIDLQKYRSPERAIPDDDDAARITH